MYANVLKFHVLIPHEKIGDPYFFLIPIISYFRVIMPPTSKKLEGHIASGLFVRPSVRLSFRPSIRSSVRHAF